MRPTNYAQVNEDDRTDFLRKKYGEQVKRKSPRQPDNPNYSDFDLLIAADPSTKTSTAGEVHAGKYSEWIIKNYLADTTGRFIEDLPKTTEDLGLYDRFKGRLPVDQRDINKLDAVKLWRAAEEIKAQKGGKDVKTKEQVQNTETKVLYKDNSVIAVQPLTYEASRNLGRGTRWCTAADSEYGRSNYNHYVKQNADGTFAKYLVIFRFRDEFRAQLEVDDSRENATQLMDIEDRTINIVELIRHYTGDHLDEFISWLSTFTNIRHHAAIARQKPEYADMAKKLTTKVADEPMGTRLALARATNLSDEELAQLKQNATTDIQKAILRYQNVSHQDFEDALRGKNNAIKLGAASNPYLPQDLMQAIVASHDTVAKTGLACNRSTPKELLAQLPQDILNHAKTVNKDSDDSRQVLLQIARAVELSPQELEVLQNSEMDLALKRALLRHQKVSHDELRAALQSPNMSMKLSAARNKALPVELMWEIAKGNDQPAKVGLANNPSLPPDIEAVLAQDKAIANIMKARKTKR